MRIGLAVAAALLAASCGAGSDDTFRVFAASSLTDVFGQLAEEFERTEPGTDVQLVLAGSASLAAQVADGAPVDVVATADEATMARILDTGRPVTEPTVFATNRLEIVVPASNPLAVEDLDDLIARDLDVAVCAIEVPCGAYTELVTGSTALQPVSFERSVRGVVTKVLLDEVDAGIAYRTDVLADEDLDGIALPEAAEVIARYPIVAIGDAPAASAFVEFVVGARGRDVLAAAGFGVP